MLANALRVWFVIAVAAFAAGYSSTGYADEPPACPMYECKDITAVWKGSSGVTVHTPRT